MLAIFRLIDWLYSVLHGIGSILVIKQWGLSINSDHLWNFEVSLEAPMRLLFIEIQWNCLSHAKGVVILDTGHHLTSHLTDMVVLRCLTSAIRLVTAAGSTLPFLETTQNRCRDLHFLADRKNSWSIDK